MYSTARKEVETLKRITKIEANEKLQKVSKKLLVATMLVFQEIVANNSSACKPKKVIMKPASKAIPTGSTLDFTMTRASPAQARPSVMDCWKCLMIPKPVRLILLSSNPSAPAKWKAKCYLQFFQALRKVSLCPCQRMKPGPLRRDSKTEPTLWLIRLTGTKTKRVWWWSTKKKLQ